MFRCSKNISNLKKMFVFLESLYWEKFIYILYDLIVDINNCKLIEKVIFKKFDKFIFFIF